MAANPYPPRRPLGITIFVALSLLGALVGLFKGLTMKAEMIAKHPRLELPLFWIYFAVVPLTISCAIGLLRLRRWSIHMNLALIAVVIGIDLWVGMEWQHPATVALMGVVMLAVTLLHRSRIT